MTNDSLVEAAAALSQPLLKLKFEKLLAKKLGLRFPDDDPVWCQARRVLITGGIRSGKTTRAAFKAFKESLVPGAKLIWLIGPDYPQAKEEFRMIMEWSVMFNLIDPNIKVSMPQNGQRSLTNIFGCRIETKSGKNPERIASVACDGIVLCEPGQMAEEVYKASLGRLTERRGWLIAAGTLEDDMTKPRWAWYEDKAVEWLKHGVEETEQAFSLPTWTNVTLFPEGQNDPELIDIRSKVSDFTWDRSYGGIPQGLEHPVFYSLHEKGAVDNLIIPGPRAFIGGAIGVDYGRTFEHPSAVSVVMEDSYGRYWVREGWLGYKSDVTEIVSVVRAFEQNYNVHRGCVDPNQAVLSELLGYQIAAGGMSGNGKPSEMRISLTNGLLEQNALFFEKGKSGVDEVFKSMKLCARIKTSMGEYRYNRPLGDDLAQATMYAIECLRADTADFSFINDFTREQNSFLISYTPTNGSAGRI